MNQTLAVTPRLQRAIDKVRSGRLCREELEALRDDAECKLRAGIPEARSLIQAIRGAVPSDPHVVFLGAGLGADPDWFDQGICRLEGVDCTMQRARFESIWPGDLLVLRHPLQSEPGCAGWGCPERKHRDEIRRGQDQREPTMMLRGHGMVRSVFNDLDGSRALRVDWSRPAPSIEVPQIGCCTRIEPRTMAQVRAAMPLGFLAWLGEHRVLAASRPTRLVAAAGVAGGPCWAA